MQRRGRWCLVPPTLAYPNIFAVQWPHRVVTIKTVWRFWESLQVRWPLTCAGSSPVASINGIKAQRWQAGGAATHAVQSNSRVLQVWTCWRMFQQTSVVQLGRQPLSGCKGVGVIQQVLVLCISVPVCRPTVGRGRQTFRDGTSPKVLLMGRLWVSFWEAIRRTQTSFPPSSQSGGSPAWGCGKSTSRPVGGIQDCGGQWWPKRRVQPLDLQNWAEQSMGGWR